MINVRLFSRREQLSVSAYDRFLSTRKIAAKHDLLCRDVKNPSEGLVEHVKLEYLELVYKCQGYF